MGFWTRKIHTKNENEASKDDAWKFWGMEEVG